MNYKSLLKQHWRAAAAASLLILATVAWYAWPSSTAGADAQLLAPVRSGEFKVLVTNTGELRARKFVQLTGRAGAQSVQVYQTKIGSIVPEGSLVKEGEVIAELDKQPVASKIADVALSLQKAQADFTTAQLDSALNLAQAREDVRTAEFTLEEKQLAREAAKYEAPPIKRQAEIDREKAQRALEQSKRNLSTKTKQAIAKMSSVGADLGRQQNNLKNLQQLQDQFTVRAPAPGMVIYVREWNGKKKGVGSQWQAWDPTVATLPDLTQMESETYVNEVDVRKLALGQKVQISLDADPTKKLAGTVRHIANVGEQRPNQDSKVFEVKIDIAAKDTTLRPGMTTANAIEVASVPRALSVPLESVANEGGYSYVFKRDGRSVVRQMVETGEMNDNEIVVRRGLAAGDRVLLTPPADRVAVQTVTIPGLKPITAPVAGGDTAKSVKAPMPASRTGAAAAPAPAAIASKP